MDEKKWIGFLSYAHEDDERGNGRVLRLRNKLSDELASYTGRNSFPIFADESGIDAGDNWDQTIQNALSEAVLFIPVISEAYFGSGYCCKELSLFLEREHLLARGGESLIFPIKYKKYRRNELGSDKVAFLDVVERRQMVDWTQCRNDNERFDTPEVQRPLQDLVTGIGKKWKELESPVGPPCPRWHR